MRIDTAKVELLGAFKTDLSVHKWTSVMKSSPFVVLALEISTRRETHFMQLKASLYEGSFRKPCLIP